MGFVTGRGIGAMAALIAAGMAAEAQRPVVIQRPREAPPAPRLERERSKPIPDWTQLQGKRARRRNKGKTAR